MRQFLFISLMIFLSAAAGNTQNFPPAAGFPGSTAIHKDSSVIKAWAESVSITRGPVDIRNPEGDMAGYGTEADAQGEADGKVVSLGDGGTALIELSIPLYNGEGPDFAVFENGFRQDSSSHEAFLEFAFVEVSSDGTNFVQFPAVSKIPAATQTGTYAETDARRVYNLAGKYTLYYGTPFDLAILEGTDSQLNTQKITHIRLIDVTGCIEPPYASYDAEGHIINDPFPTPFPSGGFDLDAVGLIHQRPLSNYNEIMLVNPVSNRLLFPEPLPAASVLYLYDAFGNLILMKSTDEISDSLPVSELKAGLYILLIKNSETSFSQKIIKL